MSLTRLEPFNFTIGRGRVTIPTRRSTRIASTMHQCSRTVRNTLGEDDDIAGQGTARVERGGPGYS
jgi:hypothetical protein